MCEGGRKTISPVLTPALFLLLYWHPGSFVLRPSKHHSPFRKHPANGERHNDVADEDGKEHASLISHSRESVARKKIENDAIYLLLLLLFSYPTKLWRLYLPPPPAKKTQEMANFYTWCFSCFFLLLGKFLWRLYYLHKLVVQIIPWECHLWPKLRLSLLGKKSLGLVQWRPAKISRHLSMNPN